MALRNYSSKVEPTQTAGEIQQLLASYGARRVAMDYDEDGEFVEEFETKTAAESFAANNPLCVTAEAMLLVELQTFESS